MKYQILNSPAVCTLSLTALMLAGCATRPPRQMGPPSKPVMPPVVQESEAPLLPPRVVEFEAPVFQEEEVHLVAPAPAPQPRKGTSYTVRKGESLSAIAVRHHMSWRDLAEYNYITDPNKIRAGQVILIPGNGSAPAPAPAKHAVTPPPAVSGSNGGTYVVQSGDSLSVIARHYGTTVSKLKEVNGLNSDRLLVGQILKLPGGASPSTPATEISQPAPRPTPTVTKPPPTPVPSLESLEVAPLRENPVDQGDEEEDPVVSKAFPIVVQEGDTLQSIANNYWVTVEEIRKLNKLPANAEVKPGQKLQIPPSVY